MHPSQGIEGAFEIDAAQAQRGVGVVRIGRQDFQKQPFRLVNPAQSH